MRRRAGRWGGRLRTIAPSLPGRNHYDVRDTRAEREERIADRKQQRRVRALNPGLKV